MKNRKLLLLMITVLTILSLASCGTNTDDSYPSKAIEVIVPFGAGGGSDQFARMLESQIEANTDYELVLVNMPGAATAVGYEYFMSEPADGYTIMIATTDTIINLSQGITEGNIEDIEGIAVPQLNIDMLFINGDEDRFSNFDELVAYSVENNVEITVGTVGIEGSEFLTISAIEEVTGAKFQLIPYSEPGERYAALGGGHIDVLFEQPGDISAFLESNDYIPIIAMCEERLESFADVPTSVENGINVVNGYWRAVLVNSEVPDEIKEILREMIINAIDTDGYKEYAHNKYLDLRDGYYGADEVNDFLTTEHEYYLP